MMNEMIIKGNMVIKNVEDEVVSFIKGKKDGGNQFVSAALLILFSIGIGIVFYVASKKTTGSLFSQLDTKINDLFKSFSVTE